MLAPPAQRPRGGVPKSRVAGELEFVIGVEIGHLVQEIALPHIIAFGRPESSLQSPVAAHQLGPHQKFRQVGEEVAGSSEEVTPAGAQQPPQLVVLDEEDDGRSTEPRACLPQRPLDAHPHDRGYRHERPLAARRCPRARAPPWMPPPCLVRPLAVPSHWPRPPLVRRRLPHPAARDG